MNGRPNHKLTGAFVIGAIALIVTGLILFGSGRLFQSRVPGVMFFSEAVTGLDVGAPILLNGVQIGSVSDIALVWNLQDDSFHTPVTVVLLPQALQYTGGPQELVREIRRGRARQTENLINRGIRAQLAVSSILTGKLHINLVMRPESEPVFVSDDPYEIPTVRSDIAEIRATARNVMSRLAELPLEDIVRNLNETLLAIRGRLEDPALDQTIGEAQALLAETRDLIATIDAQVAPLAASLIAASDGTGAAAAEAKTLLAESRGAVAQIEPLLAEARAAIARADALFKSVDGVIEPGSPLYVEIIGALRQLNSASRSIRSLADSLERNPSSILFGR